MKFEQPGSIPSETETPEEEREPALKRFLESIKGLFGRGTEKEEGDAAKREVSPKRFTLSIELLKKLFSEFNVEGKENVLNIPEGKRIILASTHTSDLDIPLVAAALSRDLKLKITHISYQDEFIKSIKSSDTTIGGILLAGRKNFLPIRYIKDKSKHMNRQGQINPEDMDNIVEALDEGSAAIIAAHNPVFDDKLPDKPGFAAIRVAQLAGEDAVVVPIAVEIGEASDVGRSKPGNILKNKPKVRILIGKPISFDNKDARNAGDEIDAILRGKKEGETLSPEESAKLKEKRKVINETEGVKMMSALADLLPEEMRGNWKV